MRSVILYTLLIAVIGSAFLISCSGDGESKKTAETGTLDSAAMVKRGGYLVSSLGCDDCHSPKRMGAKGPEIIPGLRLSGFPHEGKLPPANPDEIKKGWVLFAPDLTSAVGPWGQSFAANITPDATGIGNWSEEAFIRAIREGKYKGMEQGRNLLPPMPWLSYRNMTEEDIRSIFVYLKTVNPVKNIVPDAIPPANPGT